VNERRRVRGKASDTVYGVMTLALGLEPEGAPTAKDKREVTQESGVRRRRRQE